LFTGAPRFERASTPCSQDPTRAAHAKLNLLIAAKSSLIRRSSRASRRWIAASGFVGLMALSVLPGCPEPEPSYERPEPHQIVRVMFTLEFFVEADTTDFKILERVRRDTKSSLLALRKARVVIASKGDLTGLDITRVTKEPVTVIDTATSKRSSAVRIRFRYIDQAVVPASMVARPIVQVPFPARDDDARAGEILVDCSPEGASTARDPMKTLIEQYDPMAAGCKVAMTNEQAKIDAARASLINPQVEVVADEFNRLLTPLVATLTSLDPAAPQQVDPSYEPVAPGEPGSGGPGNPPSNAPGEPGAASQPGGTSNPTPGPKPPVGTEGDAVARARAKAAATAAANVETIKATTKPAPRPITTDGEVLDFSGLSDWNFLLVGVALLALFPLLRKSKKT
jgi:hypothetical protein